MTRVGFIGLGVGRRPTAHNRPRARVDLHFSQDFAAE
jgi:hypothetical protein